MNKIRGVFPCAANDSWDGLALMFYHSERYAPDLMNANPEYSGLVTFQGGEMIYIPEIENTESYDEVALANTSAPWKE